ncbi:MAG: WYL domain-containing protein [Betaproteobacteria bacterium]|nr:WYL domain-containing protein [Betaproteobacteria bacterium]
MSMVNKGDTSHQRLATLRLLLIWEGRLNRGRLMELFDLGTNWASVWIREFREQHPDWLTWDTKTRSFHATPSAYKAWRTSDSRRLADVSLAQYLALVGLPYAATKAMPEQGALLAAFPDLSTPSPQHFAVLSEAIRLGRTVQLIYRSMQNPKPHQRVISPHSLIRAGRRWHVRAFCDTRQNFRDFALGRIADSKMLAIPSSRSEQDDEAWMAHVRVRLIAHPDLTAEQESLIRFEYFDNTSARVETCRGALVSYFIQDVRAATDIKKQRPPDYQLAIANLEEVKPWLFEI